MLSMRIVSIFEFLIAVSAIVGGYSILVSNGGGMPVEWLVESPFSSYFWPGIILAAVVGGTYLIASISLWLQCTFAPEASAIAGFGLLIWIFTELYIINQPHWLQILYFGFAILTVISAYFLMKFRKVDV